MKFIKQNLVSENVSTRIFTATVLYIMIFFGSAIISYYLLPEGLLKNKNPLQNWETSSALLVSTLQIFSYNLLSVVVILFANLFSKRKTNEDIFIPYGYIALAILFTLNGITLGTWSFSIERTWIPLSARILQTFDILHRAGLWEMTGQLLIACATANIAIVKMQGKEVIASRQLKDIHLSANEKLAIFSGLCLMFVGAFVESYAIIHNL